MSLKNPVNDAFKKEWAAYAKAKKLPGADKPLTNDPMEATYIGIHMWKQAVEKAKSLRHRQGDRGHGGPDASRRPTASRSRWTRRTTTCTSRCSSARSRPTASSTSCGRRRARSARSRGARSSPGNDKKKDEPDSSGDPRRSKADAEPRMWTRRRQGAAVGSERSTMVRCILIALMLLLGALGAACGVGRGHDREARHRRQRREGRRGRRARRLGRSARARRAQGALRRRDADRRHAGADRARRQGRRCRHRRGGGAASGVARRRRGQQPPARRARPAPWRRCRLMSPDRSVRRRR